MRKGTTFIVVRPNGTILMQLRDAKSKQYPNTWCFPGGACNPGEEPIDIVIREAHEEYGLQLQKNECQILAVHEPKYDENLIDYVFICSVDSVQQPVLNEGAEMKWMKIDEIERGELGFEQETTVVKLENFLQNRQEV